MQQQNGDPTKPQCRILIIGGGLAGLATAIALTLAGHEAIIFERMPELKEVHRNPTPNMMNIQLMRWLKIDRRRHPVSAQRHDPLQALGDPRRNPRTRR